MPTLDWIGKKAVVNHHREVTYRLLKCDRELPAPSRRKRARPARAATERAGRKEKGPSERARPPFFAGLLFQV